MTLRAKTQPVSNSRDGLQQPFSNLWRLFNQEKGVALSRFGTNTRQLAKRVNQLGKRAFDNGASRLIVTVYAHGVSPGGSGSPPATSFIASAAMALDCRNPSLTAD